MFGDRPFNPFDSTVRRMIERLSGQKVGQQIGLNRVQQSLVDDGETLRVVIDLPGVEKEDIQLSVREKGRKQLLQIAAERELGSVRGGFRRLLPLKCRVDDSDAEAEYNNGVLTVWLPTTDKDNSETAIEIN